MTAARTARCKAIRLSHRSSLGDDPVRPLRLTLGSQQPSANASTSFPLGQLSSNALLSVAATIQFVKSTIPATPAAAKSP